MKRIMLFVILCLLFIFSGCIKMKHDITIQPIHVTMEITVKIDRALNEFFGDIDKAEAVVKDEKPVTEEEKK
jgi:hypothetical protein